MFQLAALFRTTVAGLLDAGTAQARRVQTAAMLWRRSSVQLDETARDGIQGSSTSSTSTPASRADET